MKSISHVALLKTKAQNSGGLEKYASRIASAFVEKGARVSILTTGEKSFCPPSDQISVHPFKTIHWPQFMRLEQFDRGVSRWIQGNTPDLIFGMDRNRFQTHFRAGNGVHLSYLKSRILSEGMWKYRMCLLNPLHRKILALEKESFENPNLEKIFANSHMVRKELLENYAVDPAKIEVVHNGVEWEEMKEPFSKREDAEVAKKFGLNPNSFHFLFIGNGYLRKGLGSLLEALSRIKTEDFHLSVVGKDNQAGRFQAKATRLGLKEKVRFFGSQENITPFYQLADSLVIPSFYDPFANVTVEALAMGLFVVSSKQNGGHEILDRENGTIVEDLLDFESFSRVLKNCLSHPKKGARAEKIRNSVAHLDFSKQLNHLIDLCG